MKTKGLRRRARVRKRMNVLYADERMLAGSMDLWEDSPVWIAVPGDGAGAAGGGSSLTHGKVQLAFANYTCSPCCRGESRVPAELVGTAGRGRGWAVGWDVVGVIAWLYEILKWQGRLSESCRSSKKEQGVKRRGGRGGGVKARPNQSESRGRHQTTQIIMSLTFALTLSR